MGCKCKQSLENRKKRYGVVALDEISPLKDTRDLDERKGGKTPDLY